MHHPKAVSFKTDDPRPFGRRTRYQETSLPLLLQVIVGGLAQGCVYGLIALGFVLIYKATETVNFAQGELMMLGAFCALACIGIFGMPFWLAALGSVFVMAGLGWL